MSFPNQGTRIPQKTDNKLYRSMSSKTRPQGFNYNLAPLIGPNSFNTRINPNRYPIPSVNNGYNNPLINSIPKTQNNYYRKGPYHQMLEDSEINSKRYAQKVQMLEEKMKSLDLKSQRLEVINDFFFDMFENNLVKDQLTKMEKNNKINIPNKVEQNNDNNNNNNQSYIDKRLSKEFKEFDPKEFQKKTLQDASEVLKLIKKEIADYVLEEQLRKNEEMQTMTEAILDLKHDLNNRLLKLQQRQKNQMDMISFILQNSDNKQIEDISKRILDNPINENFNNNKVNNTSVLTNSNTNTNNDNKNNINNINNQLDINNQDTQNDNNEQEINQYDENQDEPINNQLLDIPEENNEDANQDN